MEEEKSFGWGRVARLFAPHRGRVVLITVLVLGTAVLGVVNPLLIQVIFDEGLFPASGETDLRLVLVLCAVMLLITVASTALGVVQTITTNRLGHITKEGPATVRKLITEATWHAIRLSPTIKATFERIHRGDRERRDPQSGAECPGASRTGVPSSPRAGRARCEHRCARGCGGSGDEPDRCG